MKDFIPKGTGNSRFLKAPSTFHFTYRTYDAFAAGLEAGTIPIDLNGINPSGVNQVGTPLNKSTLLTDATATALGLTGNDPTVNDAFNVLKGKPRLIISSTTLPSSGTYVEFAIPNNTNMGGVDILYYYHVYYSPSAYGNFDRYVDFLDNSNNLIYRSNLGTILNDWFYTATGFCKHEYLPDNAAFKQYYGTYDNATTYGTPTDDFIPSFNLSNCTKIRVKLPSVYASEESSTFKYPTTFDFRMWVRA